MLTRDVARVRQNRVVLTPRCWRQVRGVASGPTGLRQDLNPLTTVAKEPGHRGARHKLLKPLRAGMPGVPVYSLLLVCVLPIQSAREAAGAVGTRHSPRPPRGRKIQQRLGRNAPRDRETVFDEYQRATLSAVVARHWARRRRDPVAGYHGS